MRPVLLLALAAAVFASSDTAAQTSRRSVPAPRLAHSGPYNEVVNDRLLVRVHPDKAKAWAESPGLRRMAAFGLNIPGRFANQVGPNGWTLWLLDGPTDTKKLAQAVQRHPDVFFAQPVNRMYLMWTEPNDPDWNAVEDTEEMILLGGDEGLNYRRLWYLTDIYAQEGWSIWPDQWYTHLNKPANAPTIAVVDTGLDLNHPDYRNGGPSQDSAQGGQIDMAHSKEFKFGAVYEAGTPFDQYGHGTHVAGLALASGNNGGWNGKGMIGVGYAAKGMILRVFDDDAFATDAEAAAAIYYAADNGAEVINLSLGTTNYSQTLQDAVTYAWNKGSLVVAAGGNSQPPSAQLFYPAACSGALGVSPLGPDYYMAANYGSSGSHIDVAAPGGDLIVDFGSMVAYAQYIYSTTKLDSHSLYENKDALGLLGYNLGYGYLIGSSTASPMVAGAAGLYYGMHNLRQSDGWSNVRTYQAIQRSAWHPAGPPFGTWEPSYGYGVLDVEELLSDSNTRNATVGSFEGRVYKNATPIANTLVRATNVVTGQRFETTTLSDGSYRLQYTLPGTYSIVSAPDGQLKTLKRTIREGCDLTGVDFWCGTFTWDTNPPVVPRLEVVNSTTTGITVRHRGYDTETGIDSIVWRIGTTVGGNDVKGDTEIIPVFSDVEAITGLSLTPGATYHLRGTYTNGAGMQTVVDVPFTLPGSGSPVSGTVTIAGFTGNPNGKTLAIQVRNPGSTTALQTVNATLNASGQFTFNTTHTGTRDIAAKGSHTLRKISANVNVPSGGVSGVNFALINGDVTGDNTVNVSDFLALRAAYGSSTGSGNWNPNADLNGDGSVGVADFLLLRNNFGQSGQS